MKKSHVLTIAASLLCFGAIASTIAMYVVSPSEVTITVGGKVTTDGKMKLELWDKANNKSTTNIFEAVSNTSATGTSTAEKLSTTLNPKNKIHAYYKLGMETPSGSTYNQKIAYGKVGVSVTTTIPTTHYSLSAKIIGYGDIEIGGEKNKSFYTKNNFGEFVFSGDGDTKSGYVNAPFSLDNKTYATQYLEIEIIYTGSESDYIAYGAEKELTYTVSLEYPPTEDVKFPYLRGTMNSWSDYDNYRLVPNLASDKDEWFLANVPVSAGDEMKVRQAYFENNEEKNWSYCSYIKNESAYTDTSAGNFKVDSNGTVSVYFKAYETNANRIGSTWFEFTPDTQQ